MNVSVLFCFILLRYMTVWIFITTTLQTKQHKVLNLCQLCYFCGENVLYVRFELGLFCQV